MERKNFFSALSLAATALCLCLFQDGAAFAYVSEGDVTSAWSDVCGIAGIEPLPLSIENEDVPNAWVTAGKSVTVTTGLMKLLDREEEIFGVLSHEAGHAVLKHYEKKVGNAVGVNVAALLLGKAIGDNTLGSIAVGLGANLATAGFSREQEVAADDFAVDLAYKGGKDPTGIYTSLARLAAYGGKTSPSGFNSHPPDDRRLQHVRERILSKDPDIVIPDIQKNND
ncbi:MAG: M48 family metallopeptidase [Synergistaceae bacterium]|jgi:putative metalloprotease|nr:M48 family metallopeptidase [Synergistaceae bacterium]